MGAGKKADRPARTFAFTTFGCRLNQADTAAMTAALEARGFSAVDPRDPAEIQLVHGCAVTAAAMRDTRRALRGYARRSPRPMIVLLGCPVQAGLLNDADRALVDLALSQSDKWRLPERLAEAAAPRPHPDLPRPPPRFPGVRAWLRVQDGCAFHCAYCIVPAARGAPRSRPVPEVIEEARRLLEAGYPELVLTGANLACYEDRGVGLAELTAALADLPGLARLRLGSIEPATIERSIIDLIAAHPRLCRALHLPLQSGDNDVLKRMGRRYRAEEYAETLTYAAAKAPGIGLGTDVIAGLPGETEAAFRHTRDLLAGLPLSNFHIFPYSERPGTRAAAMPSGTPPAVRKRRAETLRSLAEAKRAGFARQFLNRNVEVLVERISSRESGGWTSEYLPAVFPAPDPPVPGQCVRGTVIAVRNPATLVCRRHA